MFEILLNSENFKSSHRLMSQEVPGIYVLPHKTGKREITLPCLVIYIAFVLLVCMFKLLLVSILVSFAYVSMIALVLLLL